MAGGDTKQKLLKSISIFAACGPNDLTDLGQLLEEVDIPDGKVITREGEQKMILLLGAVRSVTTPGPSVRLPFLETVQTFDRRWLYLNTEALPIQIDEIQFNHEASSLKITGRATGASAAWP